MTENDKKSEKKSEEKLPDRDIEAGGIAEWLENFWYYHKWKLVLAAFAAVLITVCTLQMCEREEADITLLYAGSSYYSKEAASEFKAAVTAVMPRDFNGDGVKSADVACMNIYSDAQVEERKQLALQDDSYIQVNTYVNQNELQSFDNLILAGEYSVCILEPWLYERVAKAGGFRKLSDVLGYTPDGAVDEYAVKLSDTKFGQIYAEKLGVTDDTLICFRTRTQIGNLTGKKKSERQYEYSAEMFKAIIEFGNE